MKRILLLLLITVLTLCACPKELEKGVIVNLTGKRIFYELKKKVQIEEVKVHEYEYLTGDYSSGNSYVFQQRGIQIDNISRVKDIMWDEYKLSYRTQYIYHVILRCKNSPNYECYYKIIDKDKPEVVRKIDFDEVNNLEIEYVKKPKLE
ncbi:MAG: hypothetical protein KAZ87_04390 [Spirochaetes bacterium]|nr:hypothetical protein [Spirochaetota bacterium]